MKLKNKIIKYYEYYGYSSSKYQISFLDSWDLHFVENSCFSSIGLLMDIRALHDNARQRVRNKIDFFVWFIFLMMRNFMKIEILFVIKDFSKIWK